MSHVTLFKGNITEKLPHQENYSTSCSNAKNHVFTFYMTWVDESCKTCREEVELDDTGDSETQSDCCLLPVFYSASISISFNHDHCCTKP